MQEGLQDFLKRRINRASAIILGVKEREIDALLKGHPNGRVASDKLRKAVLDQLNQLHELCVDLFSSLDTGEVVLNVDYLTKLDQRIAQIHSAVVSNGDAEDRFPLRT